MRLSRLLFAMDPFRFIVARTPGVLLLFSISICFRATGGISDAILEDSPEAYWRLNEGTGATAFDASPAPRNGSYDSGVQHAAPGPDRGLGRAARFDGGSKVSIPGMTGAFSGAGGFSIEAWVINENDGGDYRRIVSNRGSGGSFGSGVAFGVSREFTTPGVADGLFLSFFDVADYWSSVVVPRDGEFHQVVVTVDASFDARFYIDGVLAELIEGDAGPSEGSGTLTIGANTAGPAIQYWQGAISEVALYSRPLADSEVAEHFEAGNLLQNGSFESGFEGWSQAGQNEILGVPGGAGAIGSHGDYTSSLGTEDTVDSALQQSTQVPAPGVYRLQFDWRLSAGGSSGVAGGFRVSVSSTGAATLVQADYSRLSSGLPLDGGLGFEREVLLFEVPNGLDEIIVTFEDTSPNDGFGVDPLVDHVVLRRAGIGLEQVVVPASRENLAGTGFSSSVGEPIRIQQLYPASAFPTGPIQITALSWRRSGPEPFVAESAQLVVKMSTTARSEATLGTVFATNIGADEQTVFDGEWTVSSVSTGSAPYPFEMELLLAHPFNYDPRDGNLLVETVCTSSTIPLVDSIGGFGDGLARVFNQGNPEASSGVEDAGADIIRFEYSAAEPIYFEPSGGVFTNSVLVTIDSAVSGTTIRYTTDGEEPTDESPVYSSPLLITEDTTVKVQLYVNSFPASDVFNQTYTKYVPPDIEFRPGGGLFTNSVLVTLTEKVGVGTDKIRYTLDGSAPTENSAAYSGPIRLTDAVTIRAQLYINQFPVSYEFSESYARVYAFADDGVSFAWRELHFGPDFLTDPRSDASGDPDGDLYTNLEEFDSETNPLDSASAPEYIKLFIKTAPKLKFTTVPQSEYRILRATTLEPADWQVVVPSIIATDIVLEFTDSDAPDHSFYQIELVTE